MRRLFSNFARGLPGIGLLLLRLGAGITLIVQAVANVLAETKITSAVLESLAIACGAVLIAGLWTPIAACLLGSLAIWKAYSQGGDIAAYILLATVGAALALIGPGAWSIDAWLFGWKRIDTSGGDR